MKLHPSGFDVYLDYKCPCGFEHNVTLEEAKTPDFKIVCGCHKVLNLRQIKSVDLNIKFVTEVPQHKVEAPINEVAIEAKQILKNYGYSLGQIKALSPQIKENTVQGYINKFLELQKV